MSTHKFDTATIFETVDQKDTTKYLTYYDEESSFTFGNYPAAVGKTAIAALVGGVFDSVASLSHKITAVIEQQHPAIVVTNGVVTYTRKDGVAKSYPFSSTAVLTKEGLIKDYSAYIDNHDLFD